MKFTKSVLALSIALVVSGVADAATKQKDDDSVREWGRWAVLMPAAGPEAGPGFAIPAGNDLGSCESSENCPQVVLAEEPVKPPPVVPPIEPPPVVVEGHCVAGAACGYATYAYEHSTSAYESDGESGHGAHVPADIDLEVEFASDDTVPAGQSSTGASADFTITPNDPHEHYPPVANRHTEGSRNDNSDGSRDWYTHSETESNTAPDGGEGYSRTWSNISGGMMPGVTEDTTAGGWNDGVEGYSYDYCDGYYCGTNTWSQSEGNYVAGTATNMDYLNSMNAGNVQATYTGYAMRNDVPVVIHIDFANETWSGAWNGGHDGNINHVDTDENGVAHVEGQVGFRANGHLSGPNIVSDRVRADDGQVTGRVDGSFFGSQAQVLGGVSDITKTVSDGDREHYTNARNVDVFVTVKDSLAERVGHTFRNRVD